MAPQFVEQKRGQLDIAQAGLRLRLADSEPPPVDV
jgi:hypothetical protein